MSVDVLREVFHHSRAKGVARAVLITLAEAAHHDGVTWIPIEPSKKGRRGDPKCLIHRANCSRRGALIALQKLVQRGEIEIRKAQRGQRRINVYRVIVGAMGEVEVDYDRLPFELDRPFGRGANFAPRNEGAETADEVQFSASTGCNEQHERGADPAPGGVQFEAPRACEDRGFAPEPPLDPSREPSLEPSAAEHRDEVLAEAQVVDDDDRETAAATSGEPAALLEVVAALEGFRGKDIASLRVVEPLALSMPAARFQQIVATAKRRSADNDVGLLVHLLKIAAAEQRAAAARASAEQVVVEEPRTARLRRDPETYLRRLLAWPSQASPEQVRSFLIDYVPNRDEQSRLLALDTMLRSESTREMFERWICEVSPELEPETVRQELDLFCDEQGLDHLERGALQELAEDARRPALAAIEEDAA